MKYRAVANGNVLDESEVPASLIAAGIYVPVEDEAVPPRGEGLTTPEAPVLTVAHEPPDRTRARRSRP